ncbi:LAFE_0E06832g1_1 [Lachancea fermentati]|uniref:LAFE_0E06832g1_1 n=1 Tax=Lachancea fermentati TaxID=4955 RepID=A0A1G4MDI7_LACFM|nr:LAFE_0E06832g1_1 [Lachancea fermentati]
MPQKALKVTKKSKDPRRITKKQKNLRKAAPLQIKSKKKSLAHMKKLNKTYSLTESTEKLIASRVGHLELLKGTRREIEKKKNQTTQ